MKILGKTIVKDLCKISVVEINKSDARSLLDKNTANRKLIRSNVEILRQTMNDGRWMFNGDSIVIDMDGRLKSGQHRLAAFLESTIASITIVLVQLFGDEDVLVSLNRGKPLSSGQYLQIVGYKNGNAKAAIARIAINLFRQEETGFDLLSQRVADYKIEDFLRSHAFIGELCPSSRELPSPMTGVIAFAIAKKPKLKDFLLGIVKDANELNTPKGTLQHLLLDIAKKNPSCGSASAKTLSRKTMSALKNFMTTKTVPTKVYEMQPADFFKFINSFNGNIPA